MPSKTEKQQKFFQIVKAYKDKKMSAAEVGKNVEDAAKDMSDKELDKYTKLTKEDIDELRELLNMKKDDALKLFNYVFDKPYEHLDVCTVANKYYKSFNPLELEY